MKKVQQWVREYFGFNQKETNGTIVLFLLMLLLLFSPYLYSWYQSLYAPPVISVSDAKQLDSLVDQMELHFRDHYPKKTETWKSDATKNWADTGYTASGAITLKLFKFDPNTITVDAMQQLGLDAKLSQRIDNYRNKGGKFRIKADMKRIYGLPLALYYQLEPYIQLPAAYAKREYPSGFASGHANYEYPKNKYENTFKPFVKKPIKKIEPFDINTADTIQLMTIRGIGPGYARRILTWREKLGGFFIPEQVYEIWGLDSVLVAELLKYAYISKGYIPNQININTASESTLKKHPYMNFKLARLIVAYRQQHGKYTSIDALKNIKVITDEELDRLRPYLTF